MTLLASHRASLLLFDSYLKPLNCYLIIVRVSAATNWRFASWFHFRGGRLLIYLSWLWVLLCLSVRGWLMLT